MLLFITSEVMFFAGLFAAYFSLRASYIDADGVHAGRRGVRATSSARSRCSTETGTLNVILPATIILVISSFTCQFAVCAIRRDDRTRVPAQHGRDLRPRASRSSLMQVYDYSVLFHEGLTLGSRTFGTTYFTLTGFHGAHVFGGVLMLAVVLYRGMAGQFSGKHHDMVEAASLYWHFVDVVWILLFSILYLL